MDEIIFNFHGLGEPPLAIDAAECIYWWDEGPFLRMLEGIEDIGKQLAVSVLITFDDGNLSDARIALPALIKYKLKARFFPYAGRIGRPNYLDRFAINDLLEAGMSIGNHGMHHVDWSKTSDEELEVEIGGGKNMIEQICGRPVDEAAIPFGAYNRRTILKLREHKFRTVFTSDRGYSRSDDWLKPRNTLDRSWQFKDVIKEIQAQNRLLPNLKRALTKHIKKLR